MKPTEVMIIRNGKPIFAVKLQVSSRKTDRETYVYIYNGEIVFDNDRWFKDMDSFNAGEESHVIAKEIFVTQLQTTIRNKILELKQLESLFKELNMENYLGSTLKDNQTLLTDVKKLVEKNKSDVKKLIEKNEEEITVMKQQITDVESQIIDVEEVKVISEKAVEEGVKSVARKSKKAVKK